MSASAFRRVALSSIVAAAVAGTVRADEEAARKYLDVAKEDIKNGSPDSVKRDLELMTDQLEGLPEATKAKLIAEAEAVQKQADDAAFAGKFDEAEKKLKELKKDRDLARYVKDFQAKPDDADAKVYFGNVVSAYSQFETEYLKPLPAGHSRTKAIQADYDKFAAPVAKLALAAQKQALTDGLQTALDDAKKLSEGNSAPDAPMPAYAEWAKSPTPVAAARSADLAERLHAIIADEKFKPYETAFGDEPGPKKLVDEIRTTYTTAAAKVLADAKSLVDAAEKAPADPNLAAPLTSATEAALKIQPDDPAAIALNKRATALTEKWAKGSAEKDAAFAAKVEATEASAKEKWAAISSAYEGKTETLANAAAAQANPGAFKDKLFRFTDVPNASGHTLGGGEYCYIITINGNPVAFKLTPKHDAAIKWWETFNAGRPVSPDEYTDVIAKVVASGKVNQIQYDNLREQFITIGTMDCPVLEVVAFRTKYVAADESGSNVDNLK